MKLLSNADWQTIQLRASLPAFKAAINQLRSEVADFLAHPVHVPDQPGGYYHDYFCPDHGVQLRFDPDAPHLHRCPIDEQSWQGERFDAAWCWFVNNRLAESAIRLALLWRLEGNRDHLEAVISTLCGYAEQYSHYQRLPRTVENPGVATYTTLDESVWVLPLAWAFDLVGDQLSIQQQQQISEQLFTPVAAHLIQHHFGGIHNFACWHNAAIGTIGVVLGRSELVEFAIHSEFGFDRQLQEGVLADGLWFEGSFSYHFYTVYALLSLVKATLHQPDYDLRQRPEVRAMLLAPIQSAYPDWSLPAPNDCWYFTSLLADCCHGVPQAPAFYEIAYAWYNEPLFAQVLQRAYQQRPRDSLDALLFGSPVLPDRALSSVPSILLPASGYAILRSDEQAHRAGAAQRYLLLKYGAHGGGHGHPDKLNLILYANGERFSPDLGTPGYGLDLFESWYRQTASHNTVTIDGHSQPEATGGINTFRSEGPFQVADASVRWNGVRGPYEGVTLRRIVLARPAYFLDLFLVDAPQPRRIDWLYRNLGRSHTSLAQSAYPAIGGEGQGYQHMALGQRALSNDPFTIDWQSDQPSTPCGLRLFVAGASGAEVITALTPGNPPSEQATTLIQRCVGTKALFLSLFHPYSKQAAIHTVEWVERDLLGAGWVGCQVSLGEQKEEWRIDLGSNPLPSLGIATVPAQPQFIYHL